MYGKDRENRLLEQAAQDDEDAFKDLYELTNRMVFQYLYRLTNDRQKAEDVMIDAYTEAWRCAKKFKGQSRVTTWLIGIARNLAMSEFRRNRMYEDELDENVAYSAEQLTDMEKAEKSEMIAKALDRLPLKHREILDLVFLQGMGYEDISRIVKIPVNTVKTRVFHAKDKLKQILKMMGVEKDDLI